MPTCVLLVDDDPDFRDLARRVLSASELVVVGETETVASGLAAAVNLRPNVVLVDVGLPDGDGMALARRLAGLRQPPRVVLTSADPDAASSDDVSQSGADGFTPKADLPSVGLELLLATE